MTLFPEEHPPSVHERQSNVLQIISKVPASALVSTCLRVPRDETVVHLVPRLSRNPLVFKSMRRKHKRVVLYEAPDSVPTWVVPASEAEALETVIDKVAREQRAGLHRGRERPVTGE